MNPSKKKPRFFTAFDKEREIEEALIHSSLLDGAVTFHTVNDGEQKRNGSVVFFFKV